MTHHLLKTLAFSTALICFTPVISAQTQTDLASAAAFQAQGQSQKAYDLLAPSLTTNAQNPDYNYVLGLAAADTGRTAEAILAFQRVLAMQPGNAKARAELARAYAMSGDVDTARDQFNTVVNDPSLPDPVRRRFDSIVRKYDREIAGGGANVSGYLDFTAGYDDNINAATDADSIVIPLFAGFGAGTLGAGNRATSSSYASLQGGVSGVKPISRQTRIFASALGSYRDNFENDTFDQLALTGTAGLGRTLANRDVVSGSLQLQNLWLDGESIRLSAGVIGQYTKRLENGRALSFSVDYFDQSFDADKSRDSGRYSAGISYAAQNYIISGAAGREEVKDSSFDNLSYTFGRINFGMEKKLAQKLAFVGGIGGQIRRYEDDDPLFLTAREDDQIDISAGLKYLIFGDTYIRPQLTYTHSSSNIALNDYERVTASLGIRREF